MDKLSSIVRIRRLKHAVERNHKCRAKHVGSRIIVQRAPDNSVWRGRVEVFDVSGHPMADRCYAWVEKRGMRSVSFTRLRVPPVRSAQTGVQMVLASRAVTKSPVTA